MDEKLICHCNQVPQKEVEKLIKKNGHLTVEEIGRQTAAGTGCGRCRMRIALLTERMGRSHRPDNQLKLKL